MGIEQKSIRIDEKQIQAVFGQFDKNIIKVEKAFGISYVYRGENLILEGEKGNVECAERVIKDLVIISKQGNDITDQNVDYSIRLASEGNNSKASDLEADSELICHTLSGRPIRPKTFGQKQYTDAIDKNMIVFGTGPAGTG